MYKIKTTFEMPTGQQIIDEMLTKQKKTEMYNIFYRYMFQYIPYGDSGNLSTNVTINELGILFEELYARYQYEGENFNFRDDTHPLASARWSEVAWSSHKKSILKEWQKVFNNG